MIPGLSINGVPDIVVIVALIRVASHNPHPVLEDSISGIMPAFPISGRICGTKVREIENEYPHKKNFCPQAEKHRGGGLTTAIAGIAENRDDLRALGLGKDGLPEGIETKLEAIGAEISAAERRAMLAERDTIDRLIALWMSDQIGASFQGRIAGVVKSGMFVRLSDTGADGFVPASTIGLDYYRYDEGVHKGIIHKVPTQQEITRERDLLTGMGLQPVGLAIPIYIHG